MGLEITFQRRLRIPDDGNTYTLPPGLGQFPIRKVEDHADRARSPASSHVLREPGPLHPASTGVATRQGLPLDAQRI